MSNVDIESIALDMDMDDITEVSEADTKKLAETKKELGNQQFKLKNYSKAIPFYTEAIELCPDNAAYYGNRSACYMMQGYYSQALDDARKSVRVDPKFIKGWIRVAKCMMAIGDINAAENALGRVAELDPKNSAYVQEMKNFEVIQRFNNEANKSYEREDFRKVVFCLDRALEVGGSCTRFKVLKAECLARLSRYQEAQELANEVLATDKKNTDAIFVRGLCLYYQDNVDQAFSHFQHVLKLAPDHSKASAIYKKAKILKQKKEEGNAAFKSGNLAEAHKLYTEALSIDSCNVITNAKLHFNRATVSSKLGKLTDSLDDCSSALALDPNYLKALLRRAKCYMDLSKFEEAVRDYEEAFRKDKSPEIRKMLHNAKLELKKSLRKDYYKILGIDKTASSDDIKRAYRKRALVHHPDRHANAPESEKKEQEKMFKEVGEAYTVLSDPNKRRRYDNGQDLDEFGDNSDIDANAMFQQFFSTQSGAQFFTQGFSGGPAFSFSFG